jgi:hypothetical protein
VRRQERVQLRWPLQIYRRMALRSQCRRAEEILLDQPGGNCANVLGPATDAAATNILKI